MAPLDADEKMILSFDSKPKQNHPGVRIAAFVATNVRRLPSKMTPEDLKRMMTIAGGD